MTAGSFMEIAFPIEFIVSGTPVSLQSKRAESREQWKAKVRDAGAACLPQPHFSSDGPISISLFFFPDDKMLATSTIWQSSCSMRAAATYMLMTRRLSAWCCKNSRKAGEFDFAGPSPVLLSAFKGDKPSLYVKISNNPHEDLL